MPSTAKGYSGGVIEAASGVQVLLSATATSALPASLTNATPLANATTGMHLYIRAYNHTTTGTITVTGTAPNSVAAVTETTTTLPLLERSGYYADYVTSAVFGAVNAAGVTLGGGLTNGSIVIYGIQASQRMIIGEFVLNYKRSEHIPTTQRGTYAETHIPPLSMAENPDWTYKGQFWPDDTSWLLPTGINSAPTSAPQPASPVVILTAGQSVTTASNASATTQPTLPGMIIQVVLASGATTAKTVTVTGTNYWGETITETVVPSTKTAGTYTSVNAFASIAANGIVWGAFGGGTIAVNGYFGWQLTAATGDTLSTFAAVQYDSIGNYIAPWCAVEEFTLTFGEDKEATVEAKGPCQTVVPLGNTSSATAQIPSFPQPLDEAIMGWRALAFADAITGTAGTTSLGTVIEGKIVCTNKLKFTHTSAWNPPARWPAKLDRGRRQIRLELKVYMDSATYNAEYTNFMQGRKRLVQIQLVGLNQLGTVGGTTYTPGWTINMPVTWVDDPGRVFTISQEYVEMTLKGVAYLDTAVNYDLQVIANTRYPSW